jgi:hypothetical protein
MCERKKKGEEDKEKKRTNKVMPPFISFSRATFGGV